MRFVRYCFKIYNFVGAGSPRLEDSFVYLYAPKYDATVW